MYESGVNESLTFTHAGRFKDVATVAIAVELGSVELEDPALWLVVECNWNQKQFTYLLSAGCMFYLNVLVKISKTVAD